MCRVLGIYGKVDDWREIVLAFRLQAENGNVPPRYDASSGHKDGWGMSVSAPDGRSMLEFARHPGSAADSPLFEEALTSLGRQPTIFLCHLRKASPGIPVTLANIHPFFSDGFAFIHNGAVYQSASLPRSPLLTETSDGSDSEHFFHYLLSMIQSAPENSNTLQILGEAVSEITLDYSALNFILANGEEMYVVRKPKINPDYYTMYTYSYREGIVVASEPVQLDSLDADKWDLLENGVVLKIDEEFVAVHH